MDAKAYSALPIVDCGEPLLAIPAGFAFYEPHAYRVLGAPYGDASPWRLRRGVLVALEEARALLAARRPGWRLKLFDAYRPVAVQAFMVWREFCRQAELAGRSLTGFADPDDLARRAPDLYAELAATVFTFWGVPSADPRTPPPHSTGAAVDLTLEDELGREVHMGCPIDETSARAFPDHFAAAAEPALGAVHAHRQLLDEVMSGAGFVRHINEWWHFSRGDQMAAWRRGEPWAVYGRAG